MQKIRVPQNSFQFGEVSDSLKMRTDTAIYTSSAQKMENMIVTVEGSAKKRTGLKHIYDYSLTYDASNPSKSHLFPFYFDNNEQYIISVEHQKVRCFRIVNATTVTLVATITQDVNSATLPFDQDYLQQYTTAQMGDVMFICHPLFAPRLLTRTSLTTFEISTYTFDTRADNKQIYQPYSKYQAVGVTLNPSATTGNGVTLTTSSNYWDTTGTATGTPASYANSLHVGVVVRYGGNEIEITSVQSATQATGNIVDELSVRLSVANPFRANDGSNKIEVTQLSHGYGGGESITVSDASSVGGINASSINGSRTVADIIDDNTYTFTAGATANSSEDGGGFPKIGTHAPTLDWDEQAWSAKRGYPAAVAFHENRLVFGGTLAEPDAIFMSEVGEYFNHNVGTAQDNEAIKLTAATGDVHEIRYLVSSRDLQVFAGTGELYVPTYLNQAITPTNAQIREQTPYGSAFVTPVLIDGSTVFAQAGGRSVREYLFTDSEDAYASTAISSISSHLIDNPKYMAVVHSGFGQPDSYAFMTMEDGNAAIFTSNRAEKRASWVEFTTDDRFDSVVSIDDRLFVNVYDANGNLQLCEFNTDIGLDFWTNTSASNGGFLLDSRQASYTSLDVIGDVSGVQTSLGSISVGTLGTINGISSYTSQSKTLDNTAFLDPYSCKFSSDGSKLFVAFAYLFADNDKTWRIDEYSLSTNWDVTTASLVSNINPTTSNLSTIPNDIIGIDFSSDGKKLFTAAKSGNNLVVYTINLESAWAISSATLSSNYQFTYLNSQNFRVIAFSPNGMKFYIANSTSDKIEQYDLTTAFDVSTESGVSASLTVSPLITDIFGFAFSPEGKRLVVCGTQDSTIEEYTSSTPFEIDTYSQSTPSATFNYSKNELRDVTFGNNDSYMYLLYEDGTDQKVDRLNMIATSDKFLAVSAYPIAYSSVYVGKKFDAKIVSNPIDAAGNAGPLTGSFRGISSVILDVKDTKSLKVNSRSVPIESNLSGKKEVRLLGYSRDPQVTIEQSDPLDMQVNGFISEVII